MELKAKWKHRDAIFHILLYLITFGLVIGTAAAQIQNNESDCLKTSLIFDESCYSSGDLFIISPWLYLLAYISSFFLVIVREGTKPKKRDVLVEAFFYGTFTIFGIAILVLLGINMYFMNLIVNSSEILWTGASIGLWAISVAITFDWFIYKNVRKVRMNSWKAKI